MSRISGLRNDMNKGTFYKEQKINQRYIHFLSKQNIKAPLILDMYEHQLFHETNSTIASTDQKNSRNGNKEEIFLVLLSHSMIAKTKKQKKKKIFSFFLMISVD